MPAIDILGNVPGYPPLPADYVAIYPGGGRLVAGRWVPWTLAQLQDEVDHQYAARGIPHTAWRAGDGGGDAFGNAASDLKSALDNPYVQGALGALAPETLPFIAAYDEYGNAVWNQVLPDGSTVVVPPPAPGDPGTFGPDPAVMAAHNAAMGAANQAPLAKPNGAANSYAADDGGGAAVALVGGGLLLAGFAWSRRHR